MHHLYNPVVLNLDLMLKLSVKILNILIPVLNLQRLLFKYFMGDLNVILICNQNY